MYQPCCHCWQGLRGRGQSCCCPWIHSTGTPVWFHGGRVAGLGYTEHLAGVQGWGMVLHRAVGVCSVWSLCTIKNKGSCQVRSKWCLPSQSLFLLREWELENVQLCKGRKYLKLHHIITQSCSGSTLSYVSEKSLFILSLSLSLFISLPIFYRTALLVQLLPLQHTSGCMGAAGTVLQLPATW